MRIHSTIICSLAKPFIKRECTNKLQIYCFICAIRIIFFHDGCRIQICDSDKLANIIYLEDIRIDKPIFTNIPTLDIPIYQL